MSEIRTPTDALIQAMEQAEDMEQVIVLYKLKKNNEGNSGIGWVSTITSTDGKIGLLEEGKFAVFGKAYGINL